MTARRLPSGGRIDREQRIDFTWDKQALKGYAGDSLASALLANNERVLGRSFKYHRPRGIMSAGVEESGAMVTIGQGARRDPNVKATMQELYPTDWWPAARMPGPTCVSTRARLTACSGVSSRRDFITRLSWAFLPSSGSARAPACG